MQQYHELLFKILEDGHTKDDRTNTGTISLFGHQMRFDLQEGFPLVTTKKIFTRGVFEELLWFISGSTNAKVLEDKNVNFWKEWGDDNRELGPIYGEQLRNMNGGVSGGPRVDQLAEIIEAIKTNPDSRRHVISLWNYSDLPQQALACCHGTVIQFYVVGNKLSCQMYQRSADAFLGLPFNIASYAALTHMIAQVCDLEVGDLVITLGDAHIYSNHIDQVTQLLQRQPRELPTLKLDKTIKSIDDFTINSFTIEGYSPHPTIKAPVAV